MSPDKRLPTSATRWSRARRVGLATVLVGTSSIVGSGLFLQRAAAAPLCATPPLTGTTSVTGVINTYYPGQSNLVAGTANTTVTVGASRGSATPIAAGDLVLVLQTQGTQIDSTNTNTYGDGVTSATASGYLTNSSYIAGQSEYATVRSVAGTVIGLDGSGANGGLVNGYTNANESATQGQRRFQVVRVPQYSTGTLSAATPPAAVAWDGSSGGVVVVDVASNLNLNSATIDVTGQGFRGGLQRSRSGATGLADTDYRTATSSTANGQKAEGIAGTTKWTTGAADSVGDGYPNGDFGRGAPGNAGGGGTDGNPTTNDENSGGGGGGNGGAGGLGGNTWSSNEARGGYGGVVVPGSASRVFLGGGGGAGSDNNAVGSSAGGAGGGIVMVRAGSLSGTGTITADGAPGSISGQDGSGGGGGGGSVVVLTSVSGASSGISGLTIRARGGAGGDETHADKHGPGGGGGGGQVVTAAATASTAVTGGVNGVHVASSTAYGATGGSAGSTSTSAVIGDAPGTNTGSQCIDVSVTKTVGSSPVIPGQTVTYTIVATNNGPYPRTGTAPITVTDTLPAGLSAATWTCTASTGSTCTASGSSSLSTTANLEVGDSATYTITATLASTFTGTLSNTATVAGPAAIPELNSTDNSATSAVLAEPRVNLAVTKTDGVTAEVPGTNATYTIVASNAGPSTATSAPITDALPTGTTSGTWTCAAAAGGMCGAASGSMPMSTTTTLSPSGSVTYTVTVAISSTATGSLANTVAIAAPAGVVETNSANNTATDTDTLTPTADLSISKTDGLTTVNAGSALTYTVVASNAGPSAITAATVTDTMPATLSGVTWTCTASAGSSCPASGSGGVSASVDVLSGGSVTFTINATVVSTATGTLSNTASVALPGGATDPTAANNTATDTTTITRRADVSITKTDGSTTAVPGSTVTYTIVASNVGPSAALATTITDTLAATLSGATWTCTASAGSTCPASGSGNISTTVDLLPNGTATFTLTATIAPTATGTLANTATAAVAAGITDPTAANNTATDTDTLVPTADLSISKTDGATGEVPGTTVTYTVVASNAGPSTVTGATVADTLPGTLSSGTWTCTATAGSSCPASGTGSISTSAVNLAPGGTATFTLTATISISATGSLANTATTTAPASVTDPSPANNTATDTDTLTPTADLSITKTDGVATATPGQNVTYTIVATNVAGPSVITGATVTDPFPASLTGVTWTCAATSGSSCPAAGSGNITSSVNLAIAGTATFTVTGTVSAAATGTLVNTATVAVPAGSNDPTGANNTATDTDTLTPRADLSITKTDGSATEVPGTSVTYTIVASNTAGPSAAPASNVTDTFPASLTGATWTCSATGAATCPTSGSGNINASVDLPVGAIATFTVSGTVAPGAIGSLTNTATVSVGSGVTDPASGNNTATDTDTLNPTADLVITKTDGATTAVPGSSVTYTVVASNAGPSTITAATVVDTMPASLGGVTWTCTASSGSSCPASGSGSINASVTLLSSGTATFTITGTISASASGSLANTATIALPGGSTDPTPSNNTATDTDTLTPTADLSITKTDGVTSTVPGTSVTYTIVAGNAGPSAVIAATVTDTMPAALAGATWTCSASGGATCPASGSGNINASVNLAVGATATFTVTGTVSASATGNLVNSAVIAAPGSVTDPVSGNNSATDTDTLTPTADLSITKTDGVATKVPGTSVIYTIVASNAGPSVVTAATVADTAPVALTGVTWTCTGTAGGTCPATGSGSINASVNLPVGASVTFMVTGTVGASATGTLVNTATVAPPAGVTDPTPANNSASDTDTLTPTADLSITKTDGSATEVPGTSVTYTIAASNAGPSAVTAAPVTDSIPASLSSVTWVCSTSGGASCAAGSGSGSINTTVDLPVGATATFTIFATVAATATGNLVNTAAIAAPVGVTDPTPANNSAADTDTLNPTADLSITKTDGATSAIPGQSTTYTVVVGNAGPSTAVNAPVADALPAGATSGTWTCVATAGASCATTSGSMPISTTATIATGATVTYTVVVAISSTATGSLTNTATVQAPVGVTDPSSANNSASDIDTLTPTADVSITKTDGLSTVVPGTVVTYTVVASNPGPSTVTGATISDTIPASFSGATWTCSASAGSTCPASGTGSVSASVTLAPGGTATLSISATVIASATGTISNTATITLPGSVADPTPANNSATDTTTVTPQTDLTITKTDGTATAVPGQSTTYTIVVTNAGPSTVTAASVTDTMPAGITSMTWTCAGASGGTCPASGTGSIGSSVNLPVGASVTFTVTDAIDANSTGALTNSAAVAAPLGVTDTNAANNSATDVDTLTPRADLTVTKTDAVASVIPGQSTTYTVTVTNNGPSKAPGTVVTDIQPAMASFISWTCTPSAGAGCTAASGSGSINTTVSLPVGTAATFTVVAAINAAATGTSSNTATAAPAADIVDPTPANNSATDTDTLTPTADLAITKNNLLSAVVPGTSVSYTVTASNIGPSTVVGATVADTLPASLTAATWTCTATGGGSCTASGSGSINATVNLPVGAITTFTISGTVSSAVSGTITNTATIAAPSGVTDPVSGNNSATDSDPLTPRVDLSITKTDGLTVANPLDTLTYTIVVVNAGPSSVSDAVVLDTAPISLTGVSWTCSAGSGGHCDDTGPTAGSMNTTVDLGVNSSVQFTITGTIAGATVGSVVNTATVSAPAGVTETDSANNAATDSTAVTSTAALSIVKTDGQTTDVAGTASTYTITVTNSGPSAVVDAGVADILPAALMNATWICTASGAGNCDNAGPTAGSINTTVDLPSGTSATFTVTGTIEPAFTGVLSNTATVTAPAGTIDNPADNTSTDTTTVSAQANLVVTKTDGATTATPGANTTYTVTVRNTGPSTVNGATITDVLPAGATTMNWTCSASLGSSCTASGSGGIADTVNLLPSGLLTYSVTVHINEATTGSLSNTATATVPVTVTETSPSDNSATDVDTLVAVTDLAITKTDNVTSAVPGTTVTYMISATNNGPSVALGATITDMFPATLGSISWTCAGACTPSGTGSLNEVVNLAVGTTVTYTVSATIAANATGVLTNTATLTAAPGTTDPTPANNTASDTDTLAPQSDLSITKTDGSATEVPGTPVTYTLTVTNNGPSNVVGATVVDAFAANLSNATWTCIAINGSCPAGGTGNINASVNLAAGGTLTVTVTADVAATATGSLSNTATITVPPATNDLNLGNNSATDIDTLAPETNLAVTKTDHLVSAQPNDVVTYDIVVSNGGPSAVVGAPFTDTAPATLVAVSWICTASSGSSCPVGGSGNTINTTVSLLPAGTATFTVTATVAASAAGVIANTANINAPAGVVETSPGNNSATDLTSVTPTADLIITKTDGLTSIAAGEADTYTIVVANAGPSTIANALVTDTLPTALVGGTWTCTASSGSSCADAAGSGNLSQLITLTSGGTATFTVTGTVNASSLASNLSNTATVAMPSGSIDPTPANNTATDTTMIQRRADIEVVKSDGTTSATPGLPAQYTIVVTNLGPSNVSGVGVVDTLPATLTGATWTCIASAGSVCAGSGSADINTTVDLLAGGTATLTINATVAASALGTLSNTAGASVPPGVTDPVPGNNSATDTDTLDPVVDLSISKDDSSATATPGSPVTYTVVVSNAGPSDAVGAAVADVMPASLSGVTWTCVISGAGSCTGSGAGNINTSIALTVGAAATFTITGTLLASTTTDLVNTATVTAPVGFTDSNPTNNSATDVDPLARVADLSITKSDFAASATPGLAVSYQIVASNNGPSDITGALVSDTPPVELGGVTWSCTATGAASCAYSSGALSINEVVDLPAGASATFTLAGVLNASTTASVANSASIAVPLGTTDPNLANNTATDTDVVAAVVDLSITKSVDLATALPGDVLTYTIVVGNTGPSDVHDAPVTDIVPADLVGASWTCTPLAGGSCDQLGPVSGNIATTVDLIVGGTVSFTLSGTVAPAATGTLVNSAGVAAPAGASDPNPTNNGASASTTIDPKADLSITKTDGNVTDVAGTSIQYSIVVSNNGPSSILNASINDAMPVALSGASWTCTSSAFSGCDTPSGTGDIATTVDLLSGGTATFVVDATIVSDFTGQLSNTATVDMPGVGVDPTLANNSATDVTTVVAEADLSITKTDATSTATPGGTTVYDVTVTNAGPSTVADAMVSDALPAGASAMSWTCLASTGSSCTPSGTGALFDLVAMPPSGTVTYQVTVDISSAATGVLVNTASITPPTGVTDAAPANNSASDTDTLSPVADLSITKSDGIGSAVPGTAVTYTVVASNAGPSDAVGASIVDVIPAALVGTTWTCLGTSGGSCTAAGIGDIADNVNLPLGASVTYTVTGTVAAAATGTLVNTVSIAAPTGTTDLDPSDNSATDLDTLTPQADLSVTKTDAQSNAIPGTAITYTVVAGNAGPSSVAGAIVSDLLPATLLGSTWTCVAISGNCPASGTGSIAANIDLAVGGTATLTITATVSPVATTVLANTATITPPSGVTDLLAVNNTVTDTDTLKPEADLSITKTDSLANARPGDAITYTIVATNSGPSAVFAAPVVDALPAGLNAASWTCVASPGASCVASGSGNISTAVDLAVGASTTFTVTTSISAPTGVIVNSARIDAPPGVSDPDTADNAAIDSTMITPTADLSIIKTDGLTTVAAGETVTYTIVATNAGPSPIIGATVIDTVPALLAGVTWTCSASVGSACATASGSGSISEVVDVASGGSATFSVTGTVDASAAVGVLTNTATIATPVGSVDPTPANNSATDTTTIERLSDLAISKDDFTTTTVAGGSTTYSVVVTNNGPSNVVGAAVSDLIPTAVTTSSWTCSATAGASCAAVGSGAIAQVVDLAAGSSVTFTVIADINAAALGPLTNTASVNPPVGVTDPNLANNTATDTDIVVRVGDLSITKTDGSATATPGTTTTYTVVVSNSGPSNVAGVAVVDNAPLGTTFDSWICAASAAATCTDAWGSGDIATTVDLAVGATATFTIVTSIDSSTTAAITNTATVSAPRGVTDPDPSDNAASDTDAVALRADLMITKTDGSATVTPGGPVVYTVTASNIGPSDVVGATVTDLVPTAVTGATWTCVGNSGGACITSTGPAPINQLVNLPVGGSVTFTITGVVDSALGANLVNTATIALPAGVIDPIAGNNSATDVDTTSPVTDLAVTKTDGLTSTTPGDLVTYTINVTNSGPSGAVGAMLVDVAPGLLTGVTWTCTAVNGSCSPSGTGSVNQSIDVAVGGTVTFAVTGTVVGSATGSITNTATVSAPTGANDLNPANNSATDTTTVNPKSDLSITKTDGNTTDVAGTTVTYTIQVSNAGPSRILDAPVADVMPAALSGVAWSCVSTGGSACDVATGTGDIATTVDLLAGGIVTFTVTATIDAAFIGTLSNAATVTMPGVGVDPTPANNTATDTTAVRAVADVTVVKTDGLATEVPGTPASYSIVVANAGPSDVVSATVTDLMPASLLNVSWTCSGVAGATCSPSGTGDVADLVNLPSGGSVTYTVSGGVATDAVGTLANSVSVALPGSVTDPDLSNNSATDVDTLVPTADLSVTKTDGSVSEVPGTPVSYTIVVSNAGPSDVVGASVSDVLPVTLLGGSWTCVVANGACPASGSGSIGASIDLASGGTATFTVTGTVASSAVGSITNTVTVAATSGAMDPDLSNNSATDVDALTPVTDLSVTKTDGVASAVPGTPVSYTIVVSNAGPSAAVGASINDAFPSSLIGASWTCVVANGSCPASGSGSINASIDVAVGGTATFTVAGMVASSALGSITNTVTVTPPSGSTDPNPTNNSASDTDSLSVVADLAITKTDNDTNARPGDPITYQIVATNAGPSVVTGAVVTDTIPAGVAGVSWTCTAGAGSNCPASGSGGLNEAVDLADGGSVTFLLSGTVTASAGTITNAALIDVPAGATDPNTLDNASTDTTQVDPQGDLSITKTDGRISVVPGATTTYTIVITNAGPSSAVGAPVIDILASSLSAVTWACSATPGSACGTATGAGNISELVDLSSGGTVSFSVTATIAPDASGVLTNTATVAAPTGFTDSNLANNAATDVTNLDPAVDLAVTKTDGQINAIPGTPITYTITVANVGPSVSTGTRVLDNLPASLLAASWACTAAPGSSCGATSGSGSIDQIVNVGVGSTLTYIVSTTVSPSASGVLANTVTVTATGGTTDTNPGDNAATDVDSLTPEANLSITKTDGAASAVPGTPVTYSIIVSNAGPSTVSGANVVDALPTALVNASWTCVGSAGGVCGAPSGTGDIVTIASLANGASATYTLTADVVAGATGSIANAAAVTAPVGVVDPDTSDNSSTDVDNLTPAVDLSITKTDGVTSAVPGTSTNYTITVENSGPSTADGALITDILPSEIMSSSWACTAAGGATCGTPNGSGDVSLPATVPAGGSITVIVNAVINPAAAGFVVNTVSVAEPSGVIDTNPANDSATDSDTLTPVGDLAITKTDGLATALPADAVTYSVVVANNGPSVVFGAIVTDVMPGGLTGATWTCAASASSSCAAAGGTGDIATTVDLATGGTATFTIDATIAPSQLGVVTNSATVDVPVGVTDPDIANNVAIDTTSVSGLGDLSIVKTDGVANIVAGTPTTYTIVVTNPGPSRIDGIQVVDAVPATLLGTTWTCASTGGAACGALAGSGSINQLLDMPAGSAVTFMVLATVSPAATGTLSNTATVTPPTGVVDSDATNNSSTDLTNIEAVADLAVTKTDNVAALTPGNSVTYNVAVVNNGPSAVVGANLTDLIPAAITGATWTCIPGAGATCGSAGGIGDVSVHVDLAVGADVVVQVTGTVSPSATGTLVNTAIVAPPSGVTDPDGTNNTASDSDALDPVADVSVAKSNGVTSQSPGATSSYTVTVTNAGPSAAAGVIIDDPLPAGVTTVSWTCSAAAGSSCSAPSGTGAINTTVDLAAVGTVTFNVSMQAGSLAGTLTNTVTASVPPGITDPDPSDNVASDTDTLVFTADIAVTKSASVGSVAAGQPFTYTVVVFNGGPDLATGVSVLDTIPSGLISTTWTCSATAGSTCPASGSGDIVATVDIAAGGRATFSVNTIAGSAAPGTVVNTATAAVGPDTIDPNPANNTDSASVAVDVTASLSVQKVASISIALPGDTFTYTIVVTNSGPASLNGVVISDPVPLSLVPLTWTCAGTAGGVCSVASGSGSPLLAADLPLAGSVTIALSVRVTPNALGPILNVVTATAGSSSHPVTAQASASVVVSPVVIPNASLSITKSTPATIFSKVGSVVSFTLVATNIGSMPLTNVMITDENATVVNCPSVTLTPGQTMTCTATHVVTQADLDRGTLTNIGSVSGQSPNGSIVSADSAAVVVPAMPVTSLSLTKSTLSSAFTRVGDPISYTITATNTGNVTLINVAISDPNGVLGTCLPINLVPGQSLTCTAVHVVTAADVAAKVVSNQAHATALPGTDFEEICPLLEVNGLDCPATPLVSADSNTVVLTRSALLPTTGATVSSKMTVGGWLLGLGAVLLVTARRRRCVAHR